MGHNAEAQPASAGFHLQPRRARPEESSAQLQSREQQQQQPNAQPVDTDLSNLPYPRWITLLTRGCFFLFEVAVLGYGIWFIKKWESDPKFMRKRNHEPAIAAAGVAMGLDLTSCVLTWFRRYGEWWGWALVAVGDVAVGITAIVGAISVMWVDHNGFSREELGWFWEEDMSVLGTFAVVVGVTHFVASIFGCAGCCLVGRRP